MIALMYDHVYVYISANVLQHKTFHRYVVRAKRGTSQNQHDNKGKAAKSAGATLRRYNEAAFKQVLHVLLCDKPFKNTFLVIYSVVFCCQILTVLKRHSVLGMTLNCIHTECWP
jgi:Bacteroidetes VLRF1 release factor